MNRLKDLLSVIKYSILTGNVQEAINRKYKDTSKVVLSKDIFEFVGTKDAFFYLDDMTWITAGVYDEYSIDDLRKSDIVLDIGACFGAFSLMVHEKCKKVYAIEPLFTKQLAANIRLNNACNVFVIPEALGRKELLVKFAGNEKHIIGRSLRDLINLCGGHVDFLKCDCEGGEWCIEPKELKGIRRIEMEVHHLDETGIMSKNIFDFKMILEQAGFDYTERKLNEGALILSAKAKPQKTSPQLLTNTNGCQISSSQICRHCGKSKEEHTDGDLCCYQLKNALRKDWTTFEPQKTSQTDDSIMSVDSFVKAVNESRAQVDEEIKTAREIAKQDFINKYKKPEADTICKTCGHKYYLHAYGRWCSLENTDKRQFEPQTSQAKME